MSVSKGERQEGCQSLLHSLLLRSSYVPSLAPRLLRALTRSYLAPTTRSYQPSIRGWSNAHDVFSKDHGAYLQGAYPYTVYELYMQANTKDKTQSSATWYEADTLEPRTNLTLQRSNVTERHTNLPPPFYVLFFFT